MVVQSALIEKNVDYCSNEKTMCLLPTKHLLYAFTDSEQNNVTNNILEENDNET